MKTQNINSSDCAFKDFAKLDGNIISYSLDRIDHDLRNTEIAIELIRFPKFMNREIIKDCLIC